MIDPVPLLEPQSALRISNAGDLVELVPYLVGFNPTESIVFIGLNGPRERIGITLRLDIAAVQAAPAALLTCAGHLVRSGADGVILVIYTDVPMDRFDGDPATLPHNDVIVAVSEILHDQELLVTDALLVTEDRWWSYLCSNPACCPPTGHPVATADVVSSVAAAATVAGMTIAADRGTLVEGLAPLPAAKREALAARTKALAEKASEGDRVADRAAAAALWVKAVEAQRRGESLIPDAEAAMLLEGLRDVRMRDACCAWAGGPNADGARAVARQLARRASPPWDVTPYALVAWFAWRSGEGALAQIAVERAIAGDPDCAFALLIQEILDRGIDPRTWSDPPLIKAAEGL
ncbi:MAG TPA: DUF4192 domain-containing protein [Mycobacteriales bacterium]|nr:DUF4192 domain-containing protein [Mycobacteriales bacterium]